MQNCNYCQVGWPVFRRSRAGSAEAAREWMAMTEDQRVIEAQKAARVERKRARKHAPNAYQLFLSARLDRSKPMTEQMRELAKEWKELPQETKAAFQLQAKQRKRARKQLVSKIGLTEQKPPRLAHINGFYVYVREHLETGPATPLPSLLKELSPKWKGLPDEVKAVYKSEAIKLRASSSASSSTLPSS